MGKKITGVLGGWDTYTSKEFTITGAQTNYNVATQQSGSFATPAERVIIRVDATVTLRFNANTNDAITVTSAENFDSAGMVADIRNVFITTTGDTAVKILRVPASGD